MTEFFALENPLLWVTVAFVGLFVLFGRRMSAAASAALDKRSAAIDSELQQAAQLRADAEAVLADYTQRSARSLKDAESIIAAAHAQAEALVASAEADIKIAMEKRLEQMGRRLDDEENFALTQVRNHVVDITIAAAKSLVADHFRTMSGEEMVRFVISDFDRKMH